MDADLDQRLALIEARLERLESRLLQSPAAVRTPPPPALPRWQPPDTARIATLLLGWGGALALVLAGVYLIRLAIDAGWLTPVRQIGLALAAGLGMIAVGFRQRRADAGYAGLLPAAGLVVWFVAVYAAYEVYGLLGATATTLAVALVSLVSLVLGIWFASLWFALFATVGAYGLPLLLPGDPSESGLVLWCMPWSVVFAVYAWYQRQRRIYLLACTSALVALEIAVQVGTLQYSMTHAVLQAWHMLLFVMTATAVSRRREEVLDLRSAWHHAPSIIVVYGVAYHLAFEYTADWATLWLALPLIPACIIRSRASHPGLTWCLCVWASLVFVHGFHYELLDSDSRPWSALAAAIVVALLTRRADRRAVWPLWWSAGALWFIEYVCVILEIPELMDLAWLWLMACASFVYAIAIQCRSTVSTGVTAFCLHVAHVASMVAILRIIDEPILQSALWGVGALAVLMASARWQWQSLAASSLLPFGAAGIKVLLHDLADAGPLVRIIGLIALGIAFQLGGWWYRRWRTAPA